MSQYRFLTPQEDLVAMRAKLSLVLKRPVYISALSGRASCGTHHKLPGETEYRQLRELEVFLLPWWWKHVHREERGGLGKDYFFSEAEDPFHLHLVIPLNSDENNDSSCDLFSSVGLKSSVSDRRLVFPSHDEVVPSELVSYVFPYKRRAVNGLALKPGILFAISEAIAKPDSERTTWHNGPTLNREHGPPITIIQAPGRYPKRPVKTLEQINRFLQCDSDPGRCVVCHGQSGERRHVATFNLGESPHPMGDMCKPCAKTAFEQILHLLEQPLPEPSL